VDGLLTALAHGALTPLGKLQSVFLSPGSMFSAVSLLSALAVAVASLGWARRGRRRALKARVLIRALFPRRYLRGASTRADIGLFLLNILPAGVLLGWALLSAHAISGGVAEALQRGLGAHAAPAAPRAVLQAAATVVLFLAYELAYWIDHYLSHRIAFLWEFHKVHHTAETLSPLTVFRVHPVDSLVFSNISAVFVGVSGGALTYAFGPEAGPYLLSGSNVILVAFLFLTGHLQHSHLWISFSGRLGRLLLSPAHHQVHHSANPAHFDRNFGSCLAVWDWAFGTLHVPGRRRELLVFGVETNPAAASPHSVTGVLITPFLDAAGRLAAVRQRMGATAS
jgi:sterol desaturase/sphingolipid hydroxylase (fatty acid hydroxylase superfamily)